MRDEGSLTRRHVIPPSEAIVRSKEGKRFPTSLRQLLLSRAQLLTEEFTRVPDNSSRQEAMPVLSFLVRSLIINIVRQRERERTVTARFMIFLHDGGGLTHQAAPPAPVV